MKKNILKILHPKKVITILLFFLLLSVCSSFLIAKFYLSQYKFFAERKLVAVVECNKNKVSNNPVLDIEFFPNTDEAYKRSFFFTADEWVIESKIVQWKSYLGLVGAKNYFKLERISGRYQKILDEKTKPRIVYGLNDHEDNFWEFLYKFQRILPFIEAVYGSSAFVRYEQGKKFYVYVTNLGLMIKDVSQSKKRSFWFVG